MAGSAMFTTEASITDMNSISASTENIAQGPRPPALSAVPDAGEPASTAPLRLGVMSLVMKVSHSSCHRGRCLLRLAAT